MNSALSNSMHTVYNMSKGQSFQEAFNSENFWNSMKANASDLGSFAGSMLAASLKKDEKGKKDNQKQDNERAPSDPLKSLENLLNGAWAGLRDPKSLLSSAMDGVREYFSGLGERITTQLNDFVDRAAALATVPERLINLAGGNGFNTGSDIALNAAFGEYNRIGRNADLTSATDRIKDYIDRNRVSDDNYVPQPVIGETMVAGAYAEVRKDGSMMSKIPQNDGTTEITITDKSGNVLERYYETDQRFTGDKMDYYDAMKYKDRDGQLSISRMTELLIKRGAVQDVDAAFDRLLYEADDIGIKGAERFKYIVDEMKDIFSDKKFYNQDHLSYSYAAIMNNLAMEFKGAIKYGHPNSEGVIGSDGYLNETKKLDCVTFQTVGLNILGLVDPSSPNVYQRNDSAYDYDNEYNTGNIPIIDASKVGKRVKYGDVFNGSADYYSQFIAYLTGEKTPGGVTNMYKNSSLFDVISKEDAVDYDLTGMIGVTEVNKEGYLLDKKNGGKQIYYKTNYLDHVYTSLNMDASIISESTKYKRIDGVTTRDISRQSEYPGRTVSYLRLKLDVKRRY